MTSVECSLTISVLCPVTLQLLLECPVVQQCHTSQDVSASHVRYTDVFSGDTVKQKQATQLYSELLEVRNRIISEPKISGPMHSLQTVQKSNYIITA